MKKIGLALSGGGARGVAHIGVIQALEEVGLEFSCFSGTSAGSIVGALYAQGHPSKKVFEIVQKLSIYKSVSPAWTWAGLFKMDGLVELLRENIPHNRFEELKKPLTVTATDIRKGAPEYFQKGELWPAIVASCSIPAIFKPLEFNGSLYVDGGLADNLPAAPIRDQCDVIIGSNCNLVSHSFDATNLKVVIERSMLIAVGANTAVSKRICDLMIEPPGLDKFSGLEMSKAKEIFEIGYKFTKENFKKEQLEKMLA